MHGWGWRGMTKRSVFAARGLFAILAVLTAMSMIFPPKGSLPAFAPVRSGERQLILDAGHGGEDGGAVSPGGVVESGINLAVVLKLDQILGLYGQAPILLRAEDISLHDDGAATLREKKSSDLHNRTQAVNDTENAVLLSVHQNIFTDQKYHGAQVFFGAGEGSADFAQLTQEILRTALDPENNRQVKPIAEHVYLLNHISCPAILVECGFLSNPQEEQLLQNDGYQTKLAAALAASWFQWLDGEVVGMNEGEGIG